MQGHTFLWHNVSNCWRGDDLYDNLCNLLWPIGKRSEKTQFAGKRGSTKLSISATSLVCIGDKVLHKVATLHEFKQMVRDANKCPFLMLMCIKETLHFEIFNYLKVLPV